LKTLHYDQNELASCFSDQVLLKCLAWADFD